MKKQWPWIAVIVLLVGITVVLSVTTYTVNQSNAVAYGKIAEMIEHGSNPEEVECAIWDTCHHLFNH